MSATPPPNDDLEGGLHRARTLSASIVSIAADREDVVQEAVRRLLKSPPRHDRNTAAYLAAAVRSAAQDLGRRNTRLRTRMEAFSKSGIPTEGTDRTPLGDVSVEETREAVRAAVDRLPVPLADVVRGHFLDDKTPEQMAQELGVTVDTIYRRRKKALEQLRAPLRTHFASIVAVSLARIGTLEAGATVSATSSTTGTGTATAARASLRGSHPTTSKLLAAAVIVVLASSAILLWNKLTSPPHIDAGDSPAQVAALERSGTSSASIESSDVDRSELTRPSSLNEQAAATPPPWLSVRVEDPKGNPVPGASVRLHTQGFDPSTNAKLTDHHGRVDFLESPGRIALLDVKAENTARTTQWLRKTPHDGALVVQVFPVLPVNGHVLDQHSNEPLAGVRVGTFHSLGGVEISTETQTAEDGSFQVDMAMDAKLIFYHDGYETQALPTSPSNPNFGTAYLAQAAPGRVLVQLSDKGERGPIRVRLSELNTGIPLTAAWRLLAHNDVIALPPGQYGLCGYEEASVYQQRRPFKVEEASPLTVDLNREKPPEPTVAPEEPSLITIAGRVLVNQSPAVLARIGQYGATDQDGHFLIRVPTDCEKIRIEAHGVSWSQALDLTTATTNPVHLAPWQHTTTVPGPSLLSGTLTNERGTPLLGPLLFTSCDGKESYAQSDERGIFRFTDLDVQSFPGTLIAKLSPKPGGAPGEASEVTWVRHPTSHLRLTARTPHPVTIETNGELVRFQIERAHPEGGWVHWSNGTQASSDPKTFQLVEGRYRLVFDTDQRAPQPFDARPHHRIMIQPAPPDSP